MIKPVFRWQEIPDYKSKGINYRLYLSQDRTFEDSLKTIVREVSDTVYVPDAPLPAGRWYYKVVARQGEKYLTGYGRHYYTDVEDTPIVPGWTGNTMRLTSAGSPYYLGSDLHISGGQNLIIMPGTRLYLDTGVSIRIEGQLICEGTSENRIQIRCASGEGSWKMIEFDHCEKDVFITHTDISNGRLVYHNTDVVLRHVVFRNFTANLNDIPSRPSLIWGENGNFVMDSCAMWGNQTGEGMNLHGGYPRVTNSFFTRIPDAIEFIEADSGLIAGNVVQFCKDDAIDMNACENVVVSRNVLLYNGDKAISVGVDHHGSSHRILIENNYIVGNRTGCDIKDSSDAVIRNNVFYKQQTAVRARQKEPGYQKGGDVIVERNVLFGSEQSELLKSEGNSNIVQSGNYANKKLDGATYIDSTLFFRLSGTPFIPSAYIQPGQLPLLESSVNLIVEESGITIAHHFPVPVDFGGCVVWDGHRGKVIPMGTVVRSGETIVLYKGKKKDLPDNWHLGNYVRWEDLSEGIRMEIAPGVVYNLTDENGKWICKGSGTWGNSEN
jgi:parallel beta-helix repeat protein